MPIFVPVIPCNNISSVLIQNTSLLFLYFYVNKSPQTQWHVGNKLYQEILKILDSCVTCVILHYIKYVEILKTLWHLLWHFGIFY